MKILIVQLNRIGDLILITPMLKALREKYAGCEIHFLAGRKNYDVALNHPLIDKTLLYRKDPFSLIRLFFQLRFSSYDVWIDPRDHESSEGWLLALAARAKVKIGFNAPGRKTYTHSMKSDQELSGLHYTTRVLTALEYLDITTDDNRPVLYVTDDSEQHLEKFLAEENINKFCCLNISANGPDRYWPTEKWIEFINAIDKKGNEIVLVSLPDDINSAEQIKRNCDNVHIYRSRSIIDIFSLVSRSEFVITVDTSIVHIASAFNKPILALYVNLQNFYSQYLPLSEKYRVVFSPKEGDPINLIPVEDAVNKYVSLQLALSSASADKQI